jgi:hypothetical protein
MTLAIVYRDLRSWALEGSTERVDLDASVINPDPGGGGGGILVRRIRIGPTASQKIPQIANRQPGGRRIDEQKRLTESRSAPARMTRPGPIPIFLVHIFLLSPAPAGIRSPSAGSRQTANTAPIHRSDELPGLLKRLIMGMQIRLGHNDVFGSEPCREIVACSEALSLQQPIVIAWFWVER